MEVNIIHLLFLCSQNRRRSLTAEKVFQRLDGYAVRSAGTEKNARVKVTFGLLGWADIILCMEKKHVRRIRDKYNDILSGKKIICLIIYDDYEFMDEELVGILQSSVSDVLFINSETEVP